MDTVGIDLVGKRRSDERWPLVGGQNDGHFSELTKTSTADPMAHGGVPEKEKLPEDPVDDGQLNAYESMKKNHN